MASPLIMESIAASRRYVGTAVGPSEWTEIDPERVTRFLEATGMDGAPVRGAAWTQDPRNVPGALLLSLVPRFMPQLIVLAGCRTGVNAGVDDCRFPVPVPVGGRVRMSARLESARGVPGGGVRLSFEVRFDLEGAVLPACTARVHYAYFP